MPRYDTICTVCGHETEVVAHWSDRHVPCAQVLDDGHVCGAETERVWKGKAPAAIDDTLPGGPQYIENLDRHPVWVESKSQLQREARARGLVNAVRHVGVSGTDKSRHTSRWF